MNLRFSAAVLLASALLTIAVSPAAAAIAISTQLSGDPRPANPDNLFIDVSISVLDATPGLATWTVDINSPLHPAAKLDAFFFNLELPGAVTVSMTAVSPTTVATGDMEWTLATPANNAPGSGGMDFLLQEALTGSGNPNNNQVNNSVNLVFTLQLSSGVWTEEMFTTADVSTSNDAILGSGQMGAHLQSLVIGSGPGATDSGFVLGNWGDEEEEDPIANPEASTLVIWSLLGVIGAVYARRRMA